MKYILTLLAFLICMSVNAQKMYLHEIESGNYKSFETGDKIEFMMKNHEGIVNGVITSFQKDGFTLNDTMKVKVSDVTALVKEGGGTYTLGRVLLIIVGGYILFVGTVYTVAGLVFIAIYPPVGIVGAILGASIGYGGYAIIKHQVRRSRNRTMTRKETDNIHYRLIIE